MVPVAGRESWLRDARALARGRRSSARLEAGMSSIMLIEMMLSGRSLVGSACTTGAAASHTIATVEPWSSNIGSSSAVVNNGLCSTTVPPASSTP